jgi:REP element-mobilizing transposase RayT
MSNKGIYNRGYLPHWDLPHSLQAITFRLADSVPAALIEDWRRELSSESDEQTRHKQLRRLIAKYEDAGHGSSILRNHSCAEIVQVELKKFHDIKYRLLEWCIMPNHVHVMIALKDDYSLPNVVQQWKGATAIAINRLMNQSGALWHPDYFDRFVRDMDHYYNCRIYIRNNPVKAKLCQNPEDWPYSSAWKDRGLLSASNSQDNAD